jgi:hypothetical protein
MVVPWNIYLALDFVATGTETPELGVRNAVRRQIIDVRTNSTLHMKRCMYMLIIIVNMETMRNFEVLSGTFNVIRFFTSGNYT